MHTSATQPDNTDDRTAIVIGGGIVGLCTAYELLERGHTVTLIDRESPGSQCSSGNAGALSAFSITPLAMPGALKSALKMLRADDPPLHIPLRALPGSAGWLWQFVRASSPHRVQEITRALKTLLAFSIERHEDLARRIGVQDLIKRTGQLHVYRTAAERSKDARSWALRREHGMECLDVDRAAIQALEPNLSESFAAGVFVPGQGMVLNPLKYAMAVADAFQARGGAIVRDEATGFLRAEDGAVIGVRGRGATYHAHHVVVAAGAWSASLLAELGVKAPLISQRGYHLDIDLAEPVLSRPVSIAARKVFLTPMDFGLRAAGIVEFGGLRQPKHPKMTRHLEAAVREAFADVNAVMTSLRDCTEASLWMGHRPCLPDSMPVIGKVGSQGNLWAAFGHGHLGLTGAASTAYIVARAISGEPTNIDLAPFAVARFDAART